MALKINLSEVQMNPHPKFNGVKVGYVVTKDKHPELSIIILELDSGVEIPLHTHEKEVDSIFIIEGEGQMYINNAWQAVRKDDIIAIGSKELHGLKAKTPLTCYVVHAPGLW
ncbi:MAG: cupin domain-containing protein [Thermodesulfovibrio sp.]|uniref:Cupin n=1 Tax=Thermodesulfovibrio aggregans TaxID=86166 RepID=A0A2J6WQ16_9BACT|nr:MAG: cupin [Thermodesulfovibrio aggregans]